MHYLTQCAQKIQSNTGVYMLVSKARVYTIYDDLDLSMKYLAESTLSECKQ